MVEFAERAQQLHDSLAQELGEEAAAKYREIELNHPIRVNPNLGKGVRRRPYKPRDVSQYKHRAVCKTSHTKKTAFKLPDKLNLDFCHIVLQVLRLECEVPRGCYPGSLLEQEVCDLVAWMLRQEKCGFMRVRQCCEALRAVGLAHGRLQGKKNLYRLAQEGDQVLEKGQLIINSLWGQHKKIGVILRKRPHPLHPVEILTVQWIGGACELVSSDLALPIQHWAERAVCSWMGFNFKQVKKTQRQLMLRSGGNWKAMSDRDRILEILKWKSTATISELSAITSNAWTLDQILQELEQEHRIRKHGFHQYSKF